MRILCVCLGNICRSPMAQGALERRAEEAGLAVEVDSAGTGAWHIGNPPDPRGLAAAAARGYDNTAQRARQIRNEDFDRFDLIVAMDRSNLSTLERQRPEGARARISLFHPDGHDIPDPYYGGPTDYENALNLVEYAADALIANFARKAD
ncbi:MAG: low molecular weight protein-tyrosine-phosphatase [Pseudomonadota bacterium]